MLLVVLDLEMVQPSTNIIQIGAVLLDTVSGEIQPFWDSVVNPGELPDQYITNLTGITPKDVSTAPLLQKNLKAFWKKCSRLKGHKNIAAWGDDAWKIWSDSVNVGLEVPAIVPFDLYKWLLLTTSGIPDIQALGLQRALRFFDIPFQGSPHNAYDDAYMTAILFRHVLQQNLPLFREEPRP